MDYFFWHNVDKYLKEKFGEKVYNRMWAYVFIAIYVVYFVCIISGVMSFTLSFFISISILTAYFVTLYIFEYYYVVKLKKTLFIIVMAFNIVIPTCTYFWAGSEDYLRVAYAFTQCVVLKQEDIVFISPKLLEWKPTGHRAVYYDIYMLKKQPTVKKMMEVIGSALGEVESYTYVDYYKPLGKYADTYDIVINDQSTIIFVEKHVEYDILMVDIGEIKGD
ncbi:hypothetical protein [Dielma fastidiosa]|uniref:Uncharacterized protein n=1 Tax=Dielma fastidiosa TaxID=1034346 RepID=A0A318L5Z2_9FIRM|nr:hypothetical protein [Dielma fastidiosa]PXX80923.1 hypothetical protein DES51_10241 [Dielma fastidiosa]